jgi:hypothetical protein
VDFDTMRNVYINTDAIVVYEATCTPLPIHATPRGFVYNIVLIKGELKEGDTITVTYHGSCDGVRVQPYLSDHLYFLVFEDIERQKRYTPLPLSRCSVLLVISGSPARYRIKAQHGIIWGNDRSKRISS